MAKVPLGLSHRAESMHWHALALLVLPVREPEGVKLCDKVAQRNSGRQRNPNNPVREGDTLPQLCPGCHWLMINPMV